MNKKQVAWKRSVVEKENLLAGKLRTLEQAIGIHGQRSLLGFQVRTNWKLCLISDLLLIFNPMLLSQISLNSVVSHLGIKSGIHNHPNVVSQKWEGKIMLCSFSLKNSILPRAVTHWPLLQILPIIKFQNSKCSFTGEMQPSNCF